MSEPFHLVSLLPAGWRDACYEPFRDGVEISPIVSGEPAVALLRYAPGAGVPRHRHMGLETILVLDGVQCDERGAYPAGTLMLNPEGSEHSVWSETLMLNPEGSEHSVWSETGCVVLIQWTKPVEFVAAE